MRSRVWPLVAVCLLAVVLWSCDDGMEVETKTPLLADGVERTATMHLDAAYPGYADEATRAGSAQWEDGEILYIRFYSKDKQTVVCGKAVYDADGTTWNVSYYGSLPTGETCTCEVYYFTSPLVQDNFNVILSPLSGTWQDEAATYNLADGELHISATLLPKTMRMRVKGTAGAQMKLSHVSYVQSFGLTDKKFTTAPMDYVQKFDENGNTPYFYCILTDDNKVVLTDTYYIYTKAFDPAKFAAGKSGYIDMPSQVLNKGWVQEYYYPDNAVDMGLSVRWASFNVKGTADIMQYSWGDLSGKVTSTSYSYNQSLNEIAGNAAYDVATRLYGERWGIPTKEQWEELMTECTWTYAYNSSNGIYGYTVTAANGNSIYLPIYNRDYGSLPGYPITSSSTGYYWTATPRENNSSYANALYLTTSDKSFSSCEKYFRMVIRPILIK